MRKRFPNVQVVGLQFGMADRAKAVAATENIPTAHPDLAGLFADNESTRAVIEYLAGRKPERLVDSGVTLVRAADLDLPDVRALLFPDISRYLNQP